MTNLAKILGFLRGFRDGESGAVTVEWIVITAAALGLGLAVTTLVSGGAIDLASDVSHRIDTVLPSHGGPPPPPPLR